MAEIVYILCTLSCLVCTLLLFRGFLASKLELLFWSAICFAILAVANFLLIIDLILFPSLDLSTVRSAVSLCAVTVLIYGFIFKSEKQ